MKKNIIWLIMIILVIIGVALVIGGTAPEGSSYHINTYTNTISGASTDTIIVQDKISMQGGLVVETCCPSDCPSNPQAGQMWLVLSNNYCDTLE